MTMPPNKGMKQTKPAQAMELRSLSPVFAAFSRPHVGVARAWTRRTRCGADGAGCAAPVTRRNAVAAEPRVTWPRYYRLLPTA
jgi:hypothetical protein